MEEPRASIQAISRRITALEGGLTPALTGAILVVTSGLALRHHRREDEAAPPVAGILAIGDQRGPRADVNGEGSPRGVSQASSDEPNSDTPIPTRKTLMLVLLLIPPHDADQYRRRTHSISPRFCAAAHCQRA